MIVTKATCEACVYWDKYKLSEGPEIEGRCRRYPSYTIRRDKDWCGEFKNGAIPKLPDQSILPTMPKSKGKSK